MLTYYNVVVGDIITIVRVYYCIVFVNNSNFSYEKILLQLCSAILTFIFCLYSSLDSWLPTGRVIVVDGY